jgi:transcription elongation factor Elf1
MEKEVECPWCGEKTVPDKRVLERQSGKVVERNCSHCGKVIACYLADEPLLDLIRERVVTFKD